MCQSTRREERGLVMLKYLGHGVIVRRGESAHLLAVLVMVHALHLVALLNSLAKQLRSNGGRGIASAEGARVGPA